MIFKRKFERVPRKIILCATLGTFVMNLSLLPYGEDRRLSLWTWAMKVDNLCSLERKGEITRVQWMC